MKAVAIHDAKTHLSRLIARVEEGEEIVLRRRDKPVAKLVPYAEPDQGVRVGTLRGEIELADDFDDLPEEFADYVA